MAQYLFLAFLDKARFGYRCVVEMEIWTVYDRVGLGGTRTDACILAKSTALGLETRLGALLSQEP